MASRDNVTPAELGSKFIRWGLGLFILGFIVGFVPILHYMLGAVAGDVGPAFLKNMTLWWGCPAVLMEYALKMGSLGMVVIGLCYVVLPRTGADAPVSGGESMAPMLCLGGLMAAFVYMAVGYVVCSAPKFPGSVAMRTVRTTPTGAPCHSGDADRGQWSTEFETGRAPGKAAHGCPAGTILISLSLSNWRGVQRPRM